MEGFNIYYNLLFVIISFITLLFASYNDFKKKINDHYLGLILVGIFSILYFYLFGSRDLNVGADTVLYNYVWNSTNKFLFTKEFFFNGLMWFLKSNHYGYQSFLYCIAFLFMLFLFLSIKRESKENNINPLYLLFSLVSLFFFKSIGINIIRQGISLAILLLYFSYFDFNNLRKNKFITFFLGGLALIAHNTTIIPIIIFILLLYLRKIKIKYYLIFYFLAVIASYFKIGIHSFLSILVGIDKRRVDIYVVSSSQDFVIGFKPQFVAFNTFFLFLFLFIKKYSNYTFKYDIIFKYYIVTSCLFFLVFQMPYSDRWGIMSWIVIPYLLIPVFNNNFQKRSVKTVISLMLIIIYSFFIIYI